MLAKIEDICNHMSATESSYLANTKIPAPCLSFCISIVCGRGEKGKPVACSSPLHVERIGALTQYQVRTGLQISRVLVLPAAANSFAVVRLAVLETLVALWLC